MIALYVYQREQACMLAHQLGFPRLAKGPTEVS
jgi:hypothetical protein